MCGIGAEQDGGYTGSRNSKEEELCLAGAGQACGERLQKHRRL